MNNSKVSLRYHGINHNQRKIALNFSEKISIYKKDGTDLSIRMGST